MRRSQAAFPNSVHELGESVNETLAEGIKLRMFLLLQFLVSGHVGTEAFWRVDPLEQLEED